MGKRSAHRRKGDKYKGNKQVKTQWKSGPLVQQNLMFKSYYQLQLNLPEVEFQIFWEHMKIKLPVVFRVNPNCSNYRVFCEAIKSEDFLKKMIPMDQLQNEKEIEGEKEGQQENQPTEMPKLKVIEWYPGGITFELNASKQMFKKSKILGEFHKYLQKSFDAGLISRQELVSMLPPLYLDLKETDIVLDICAAPGSKTSQILQIMSGESRKLIKGCVVANDADYSRAHMLIHQLQRAGTAAVVAVNHLGQFIPQLWTKKINHIKQKFKFDKILCDVPCSGDGATRKIPIKWAKWHTSDGIVLHPLQLAILMKSINLLKKGGLLVYSTCSLNPIENQAVISALMQKVECGLEIVDIHPLYKVKGRRGMTKWHVCTVADKNKQEKIQKKKRIEENNMKEEKVEEKIDEKLDEKKDKPETTQDAKFLKIHENYEQGKSFNKLRQTMFPLSEAELEKMGLQNTMRILPHDQNSGGFFVALLKKHNNFQWRYKTGKEKKEKKPDGPEEDDNELDQEFLRENLPETQKGVALENDGKEEEMIDREVSESDEEEDLQKKEQPKEGNQVHPNQKSLQKIEKKNDKASKYDTYANMEQQEFRSVQEFYGLDEKIRDLLFVRENNGLRRKVLLVTEGVAKFLKADTTNKIKLVNMGCTVFQKGKQSFAGHQCLYRLYQEGVHFIMDYATKRKVKVSLDFFKTCLKMNSVPHQQIQDQEARKTIQSLTLGALFIYIDEEINGVRVVDAMVGQNFRSNFHLMVPKDDLASLVIRYC